MIIKWNVVISTCCFASLVLWTIGSEEPEDQAPMLFIPNLNEKCYRCLCYVSTKCDFGHGCTGGYCGPFNISRVYWADAGRIVQPDDDPERNRAWEDCARDYFCSKKIIKEHLGRYGRDCNMDGVTDCYDYMLINGNGKIGCTTPLNKTANGRRWLQRYANCTF